MKNTNLRKQLADCLKYYNKQDGYYIKRELVEDFNYNLTGASTLEDILYFCKENNIHPNTVTISGYSGEDYDGYPENGITISTFRKQTDEEYFDLVCSCILPTKYQQEQYEQYLKLKRIFG